MSSGDQTGLRVLLLLGAYRADLERDTATCTPVVAGALDRDVWSHEPQQDTDERWAVMRELFDSSGMEYEWREAWVELDAAALCAHVTQPAVDEPSPPGTDTGIHVLLLVGGYRADLDDHPDFTPLVAGAVDRTVWEHEPPDETSARWEHLREAHDPHGFEYEWREVWVTLDEDAARAHFTIPTIKGTVAPSARREAAGA